MIALTLFFIHFYYKEKATLQAIFKATGLIQSLVRARIVVKGFVILQNLDTVKVKWIKNVLSARLCDRKLVFEPFEGVIMIMINS